jgi:DNA-binding IclR family transcriptional regulator/AraC-like DNA-binding protein
MLPAKIISVSTDVMRQVESQIGQTIGLGCLNAHSGYGTVLAEAKGTSGFAYHLEVNYQFPLHTSAPGKAMLAYLSATERSKHYAAMDFRNYTPSTITNRNDFEAELESVFAKGYSIDVSEQMEGCHCVGVPVFDEHRQILAGLWTTGPSSQLPVRYFEQVAEVLKKGSQEITQRLRSGNRSTNRDHINSVVEQAREIIETSLHQPLDGKLLAENLYVSYSWFRKVFKEQTGEAPAEYHLKRRIQKACKLLKETAQPVRQISEELSFKNQNHFSALFKRKIGCSPLHYRNSTQQ